MGQNVSWMNYILFVICLPCTKWCGFYSVLTLKSASCVVIINESSLSDQNLEDGKLVQEFGE